MPQRWGVQLAKLQLFSKVLQAWKASKFQGYDVARMMCSTLY